MKCVKYVVLPYSCLSGPPVNKAILFEKQAELREAASANGIANAGYKGDTLKHNSKAGKKQDVDEKREEEDKDSGGYGTIL